MGMAIKSALEYLKDFDSYSPYQEAIDKVSAYIEQMQEPRKGHWISRWYAGHDLHFHVCSECNEEFSCDMETGISIDNYRYCPNCGAKMESEGKE